MQDGEDKIDEDKIKDLVGIPKLEMVTKIVEAVFKYDVESAIPAVNDVIDAGKDLNNLLWEIIKYIKDILVYKVGGKLQIYNKEEIEKIKSLAELVSKERLLQIIYDLSELENDMKWSSQRTILFQVEIIKLCSKIILTKSMENVEKQEQNEAKTADNLAYKQMQSVKTQTNNIKNTAVQPKKTYAEIKGNNNKVQNWSNIVNSLKQTGKILLYTNLLNSVAIEVNDMTIGICFPNGLTPFGKSILEKPESINELSKILSIEYGKEMRVKIIEESQEKNQVKQQSAIESMADDLDIPINIIDE